MSPLSDEDALAATDPNASEEERQASAKALQNGVLANEIYWRQHTDVVTALKAQIAGHGEVVRGEDNPEELPPAGAVVSPSGAPELTEGEQAPQAPSPEVTNPNASVAALRKQLEDAGITPVA